MPYDDYDDDIDISIGRRGRGGDEYIPNYLTQAILVTLCCCIPFGIVAIIKASQVNSLIAQGDYEGARNASGQAKMWCILSAVFGCIGGIVWGAIQAALDANRHGGF